MKKRKYTIAEGGLGNFLSPPNRADHFYRVQISPVRFISLDTALEEDDAPADLKSQIEELLKNHPGEFTEKWEHSCYNYFRHCYSPDGVERDAQSLIIDKKHIQPPERHAAYLHIRDFFPHHQPNLDLIKNNGDKGAWSIK